MNEKRAVFSLIFGFVLFIFLFSNAIAAIGVSPNIYEQDFTSNLKETYKFEFFSDSPDPLEVYSDGDLAKYVKLDVEKGASPLIVHASLSLPAQIDVPGQHRIYIGAKPVPSDSVTGFSAIAAIRGTILIKVPYPGKYAEISFSASNANAGQPITFKLKINSRGVEAINTENSIEIFDFSGNKVQTLQLDSATIESTKYTELTYVMDTQSMKPGNYKAVAYVNYNGKTAKSETVFKLGELRVEISKWTEIFKRNKINRIEVGVESLWNDPLDNIYVTGRIQNYDINFITPSISMKGFEVSQVTGFFDTSEIKEDTFKADLFVHYGNKTSGKTVELRLEDKNYSGYYIIAGAALLVIVLIAAIVVLWRKMLKHGKKKK